MSRCPAVRVCVLVRVLVVYTDCEWLTRAHTPAVGSDLVGLSVGRRRKQREYSPMIRSRLEVLMRASRSKLEVIKSKLEYSPVIRSGLELDHYK